MNNIVKVREKKAPEIFVSRSGKKQFRGGRWNVQAVADFLIDHPTWQTLDDLARLVYGSTGKLNRTNVRKHIPAQRRHMLHELERPIVTSYGERGTIRKVKLYSPMDPDDQTLLHAELMRARDRKEISETRFNRLEKIFLLSPRKE